MSTGEAAVTRRRGLRWERRGDLGVRAFPAISSATVAEQQETIDLLREWAEQQAEDAIAWYLRDKKLKRSASKLIRAMAVALAVAGGIAPLQTAVTGGHATSLGYVLLAVAAGCMAFDYFFGLSSGWMRDITALQAMQRELTRFRLAWAAAHLLPAESPPANTEGQDVKVRQIALISELATAVGEIVDKETSDWLTEFRSSLRRLNEQADVRRTEQ
jgi:hypothetical protein